MPEFMEKNAFDILWNPVTGCMRNCEYCYARDVAKQFSYEGETLDAPPELQRTWICDSSGSGAGNHVLRYPVDTVDGKPVPYPFGFAPTFHRYLLNDCAAREERNILVCSMADLFGDWIPDEWIQQVFKACEKAPQHNYFFLTKNPKRYAELKDKNMLPAGSNMWYGFSITNDYYDAWYSDSRYTFASIEPVLGEIKHIPFVDWVIIGAETGRKDNVVPERRWVEDIVNACREKEVPIYMKPSLAEIWGRPLIQEFPDILKKL